MLFADSVNRCLICLAAALCIGATLLSMPLHAQSTTDTNLNDLPSRLIVPEVQTEAPAAGRRVWQQLDAYRDWQVRHALYLPVDWIPGKRYPVIFEYPGNGNYRNKFGDVSDGTVEGCRLGYGLSEGKQAIWVCLPFVDVKERAHATQWWGDADETVRYAKLAIDAVCRDHGGDPDRLFISGFSRGAIACSYIGLRDDEIAKRWRGIFAHSHYDGVRLWKYADCDADSATARIRRFASRSQWISHEQSIEQTQQFFDKHQLSGAHLTFRALPYPNHSVDWLLKDNIALADEARRWFREQAGTGANDPRP